MRQYIMFALLVSATISAGQAAKLPFRVHAPAHHYYDHVHVTEKPIAIISQDSEVNPDGSFHNVWESENGIKVQEEGTVRLFEKDSVVHSVNGQISYIDPEGNPIVLTYVADETGFHPQGDHLPTPPPLPIGIARGLEWSRTHPYVEDENVHHDSSSVIEDN